MSDVLSGRFVGPLVPDNRVNFGDPRLNSSREIPPKAVGGGIFDRFVNSDHCKPEVVSDVISGVFVEPRGVKVAVKLSDSRSNCSRDIRLPHLVTNDDDDDNDAGRRTL